MNRFGFINTLLMLVASIALVITSGCISSVSFDQSRADYTTSLNQGTSIGQSFLARYDGIKAISVYFKPAQVSAGNLHLVIKENFNTEEILSESVLTAKQISTHGYYKFQLDKVLPHSSGDSFIFEITLDTSNEIPIGTAAGDIYLHGSAYKNRIPTDDQLAFRVHYDKKDQYNGLISEALERVGLTIIALMLLVIPGWGILSHLLPDWSGGTERETGYSLGDKIGISSGFSIVIYPILYLWTRIAGLQIGYIIIWIPFLLGSILILIHQRSKFIFLAQLFGERRIISELRKNKIYLNSPQLSISLLYIVICLILLLTRFWPIRMIDFPMWGDSYQHTMIAQLLIDNNGLFDVWKPYAELPTFTYHFGFHTIAAAMQTVARISIESAVLSAGQYLNIFAVLALYPLASRLAKSQWAGLSAIVIAGFLTAVPMYYINWGRYTQLTGMVILASAVYLTWIMLDESKLDWVKVSLSGVILAGLALTHYRIVFFAIFFCIAYFLVFMRRYNYKSLSLRLLLTATIAGIIFLPWFIKVYAGQILDIFANQISTLPSSPPSVGNISEEIGNFTNYLPPLLWLSLPLSIGWGLWRNSRRVALFSIWWLIILFATNPQWLTLPGTGIISNFTLFIAAYFPTSLLVGSAIAWIIEKFLSPDNACQDQNITISNGNQHLSKTLWIRPFAISVGLLIIAILGARQRIHDVKPDLGTMVTEPDQRAMEWIDKNMPQEAKILINSFSAYYDTTVVGSDGGWWIPLLTERYTNVPPINYVFEKEPWGGYQKAVLALPDLIYSKGINDQEVLEELKSRNIDYLYVGQRHGEVNNPITPYLDVDTLLSEGNFTPIYHQDRVWIFEIES